MYLNNKYGSYNKYVVKTECIYCKQFYKVEGKSCIKELILWIKKTFDRIVYNPWKQFEKNNIYTNMLCSNCKHIGID